jgi:hypothetical protein
VKIQRLSYYLPHFERRFFRNLGFAHLDLRSNRSWNGIGTDEFESSNAVVDYPIFRRKAL